MSHRIVSVTPLVTFEVDTQKYKHGRFTMPAEVLRKLDIVHEDNVHIRIESMDGQKTLWSGILKMQSVAEIDCAELSRYFQCGERIRVAASKPELVPLLISRPAMQS